MSEANESLLDLEQNLRVLEESIKKLEKAIQHWKTWDAEYEALKEEVDAVAEPSQVNELHRIHRDFEGELLTGKELDEVFGQPQRTKEQIVNLLDRRIDYVSKNVETLEKQLELAEEKHAEASVAAQPNIAVDEDGQPITEIIEELDEDGNVISYELQEQGEALPQVQEMLKKAGLQKQKQQQQLEIPEVERKEKEQVQKDPKPSTSQEGKKVAFADDTKAGDDDEPERSQAAKRVDKIMKSARQQTIIDPIIPDEEDEDDALLRQQMLKYSMGEVGAVVAELDIEEDDEGYGDEDMDDYDFDDDEDEEMEDEDKWGRFTGRVVTDDYRERMLELEKKLGIKSGRPDTQKAVQSTNDDNQPQDEERVGRIVVKTEQSAASDAKPTSNGKKGVRFADELDIAPRPSNPESIRETQKDIVEPLGDVVERSAPAEAPTVPEKPARQSRFKKARRGGVPKGPMDVPSSFFPEQEQRQVPTGPAGQTISDKLVEKDIVAKPAAPDELDDSMIHFEVADEHQRMRRKFIQREGGFLAEDESPIQPLDNDAAEPVSRFKAARLSRQ